MARSKKATEKFRLQAVQTKNAQGKESLKFLGLMRVTRDYTDAKDSNNGAWFQLCPGLFYQRHENRTSTNKDGRAVNSQFEGIDIMGSAPAEYDRFDFVG